MRRDLDGGSGSRGRPLKVVVRGKEERPVSYIWGTQ